MRNLAHFRRPLLDMLTQTGSDVVAMAPADLRDAERLPARQWPIGIDRGGTNPAKDLATLFSYIRAFRQLRPAAVLGFTPKANIYGGLAARHCGIMFVPTVSGLGTGFLKGGVIRAVSTALYRSAFARSPVVLFQNPDDRDEFVRRDIVDAGRARLVAGSGVDLGYFRYAPPGKSGPFRLLFIGRFLADKGLRELTQAVRLVKNRGAAVSLTLVGAVDPDNPSSIPEAEIREWVAKDILAVAGPQRDVRPLIENADAVVLPSYREGLPRVLLEAGAMGRPMIASDVPGCREVVINGKTGLLCEARSAASLSRAICDLMAMSEADRIAMGQAARRHVEQRFDQALVIAQYRDVLSQFTGLRVDQGS